MEEPRSLLGEKLRQFPDPADPADPLARALRLLPPRALLKLRQPPAGPLRDAPPMRALPAPPKRLATA